ncbi:MAG: hypothetical protein HC831_19535 [Chloroflexia bacterium]|nr:hypothetical protein [Chloroflexia bacterium]
MNESYGRYVLYNSSELEVVVMSWNKGDYTSIHDHGAAQWGAVLCFGRIEHTTFSLQNQTLTISNNEYFNDTDICLVTNQLIHQMGNPFDKPTMTLHFYGTRAGGNEVTENARNYDPVKNKVYYANGGAFLEIAEQNIMQVEECPSFQSEIYHRSVKIFSDYKQRQLTNTSQTQLKNYTKTNIIEYI